MKNTTQSIFNVRSFLTAACAVILLSFGAAQAATFTVASTGDAPFAGTLRDALLRANNSPGADTINFNLSNCPCVIQIHLGEMGISDDVTINGLGANLLTVSGANNTPVFRVFGGVTAAIDGLTIRNGKSRAGGGIRNSGSLMLSRSVVTGNRTEYAGAGDGNGGGIYNEGSLTVIDSVISQNQAAGSGAGGGIYNANVLYLLNSTVSGNSARAGGGVSNQSALSAVNSTISSNSATHAGGGFSNGGNVALVNCTVVGNRVAFGFAGGGGINSSNYEIFRNTIIAGNTAKDFNNNTTANDIKGTIDIASNTLVGNAASAGGIAHGSGGNIVGVNGAGTRNISTILNTALANNGGLTPTHALVAGSAAIDAGDIFFPRDQNGNPLPYDQRGAGFPRSNGAAVDLGAFETPKTPR